MGSYKVLCIDDEQSILKSLKRCLAQKNFNAVLAEGALEGLRILSEQKDNIGLIIVDLRMPRMNGIDFLHEARKAFGSIPAIILSGYMDADPLKQVFQDIGRIRFVSKPWVNEELLELAQDMIKK